MAGVYTDNQPDFSFLQPGETKSWSQYWYPIQKIGPAHHANLDAAVNVTLAKEHFRVGIAVTRDLAKERRPARTRRWLRRGRMERRPFPGRAFRVGQPPGRQTLENRRDRAARSRSPWLRNHRLPTQTARPSAPFRRPPPNRPRQREIASADELYVTGLHLEQYRHATRCPTLYWREALRRDPLDARCNNALGLWHLKRGEFAVAEACFRKAIERLTRRNANPDDGEPYYNLGLCLRHLGRDPDEAYAAFYKSDLESGLDRRRLSCAGGD